MTNLATQAILLNIMNRLAAGGAPGVNVSDAATHILLQDIILELQGTIDVNDTASQTILANILLKLNSVITVDDPNSQGILTDILLELQGTIDVNDSASQLILNDILVKLALTDGLSTGTENGTTTGIKHVFVNNYRKMILDSHDRTMTITYADFGTKDQRVTQMNYQSATFPGLIARKILSYTLIGNKYRRDSINWIII